jgi:hypothetical protein
MEYLDQIFNQILPVIDWVVFFLVITSGYLVRGIKTPKIKKYSTIGKVLVCSLVVSILYSIFAGVNPGKFIASYFIAFGFHTVIIKKIEGFFVPKNKSLVGDRPDDR